MEEQPPVFEKAGSTRTLNVFFNKLINLTCLYFGKNLKVSDKKNKKTLEFTNPRENKNTIFKGDKVFHQKFGYGLVINLENENAEVRFEKTSTKKVKIDYLIKDV